jgi:hypothetical protein
MARGELTPDEGRESARLFEWVTDFEPDARPSLYSRHRGPFVVFGVALALGAMIVLVAALWPVGAPST